MIVATCHCGAIRVEAPRRPRSLTDCNCSICRRYGALWAYYRADTVRVHAVRGAAEAYVWGGERLRFVRCARCGCVTHWERTRPTATSRVGVNARNFPPDVLGALRVRHLDGASSWKYLD
jgi:hypothetical protein